MVIQRWQSVLLFVAAALMACFTFIPFGVVTTQDFSLNLSGLGFHQQGVPTVGSPIIVHTWYFFILCITTIVILLLDIFLYKNIRLQQRVCLIGIMFIVTSGCVAGLLGFRAIEGGWIYWKTTALCPFIALFSAVFSYYRMAQDYALLKAADRLR